MGSYIVTMLFYLLLSLFIISNSADRFHDMDSLIEKYISQHSYFVLNKENDSELCSRQYIISDFYCSQDVPLVVHTATNKTHLKSKIGIGTIWGIRIPNDFALAILLNRTLILQTNLSSCNDTISLKNWVVTSNKISAKLLDAGCPISKKEFVNRWRNNKWAAPSDFERIDDIGIKFCFRCEISADSTTDSIQYIKMDKSWWWYDVYHLFHYWSGVQLSPSQQAKYNLLYSSLIMPHHEAAGFLLDHLFNFSQQVIFETKNLLNFSMDNIDNTGDISNDRSRNIKTIGIHIRHQDERSYSIDREMLHCAMKIRQSFTSTNQEECLLVISTDRNITYYKFLKEAHLLNCTIKMTLLSLRDEINEGKELKLNCENEHGVWSGYFSIFDLHTVANTDYFIGTPKSSFTSLIQSLFIYYNVRYKQQPHNVYNIYDGKLCSPVITSESEMNYENYWFRYNPDFCSKYNCTQFN